MGKVRVKVSHYLVLFTNGQVLLGKFQWVVSLLLLLGVFKASKIYYYVFIPLIVVVTVVMGYLYDKLGIRKIFDEENSKYVLRKIKEDR